MPIGTLSKILTEGNLDISPVSSSVQGASPQFQIAALKTAQDTQKKEGEAAVNLIQDAVQATEHSITGNNIDVTA